MPRFQHLVVHPGNPQPRLLQQAAERLRDGDIALLPTVAGYLLGCRLEDKAASQRLTRLAALDDRDPPVLLCRDLAQAAAWLHIDDQAYRAIRQRAPGTASFTLPCTRRVPRRLASGAKGVALLYFAGHAASQELLQLLDEPLLLALPPSGAGAGCVEQAPATWHHGMDLAINAGLLPALAVFPPRRGREPSAHNDRLVAEVVPLAC
ncbi:Sua5/YciO/YrdC/YwlC family protein [Roseateles asaccharophilus]|uniref:YrdC-like domain-containing protein n=1 Tax=Roseateles asaccharophilus TaxID=582607 RepID=A0ABU2AAZ6_9BURK|nr:Sua5/YciO/YrdC/YwlC family protein [Roseateles asaccharophilus]MDR7333657.1 hypothetical protein [Roseateles asaccharophilus]